MKRTLAIALLTLRAAFRYRVVLVLGALLLAGVVLLPLIIKDDGTASGFTQIILTYTLSLTTALLGFSTLWLSCGILAREIEEAQLQMVVVKPVARWQIWLGKWLGIVALNAMLLALAGTAIFFLMQWRAGKLPAEAQTTLRNEIFVARKAALPPPIDYETPARQAFREAIESGAAPQEIDPRLLQEMMMQRAKAQYEVVPPNHMRFWEVPVGNPSELEGSPMYVRFRFDPPMPGSGKTYPLAWQVGDPMETGVYTTNLTIAGEAFTEFAIPSNLVNKEGVLHVVVLNQSESALIFPLDDGLQILYRTGGFALNFVRGLGIILCWLALLAALGLAGASFLSFPVAAFCTLAVLFIVMSSGTLNQIVVEGGIMAVNPNTGEVDDPGILNTAAVFMAKGMLALFNLARGFSPIDYLSSGRVITWGLLAMAFLQIVVVLCGILGALGVFIFTRRELAAAQGSS